MGEEAYNKALAISTTTGDVVCLAGAVKNTVKGIRDAKAAKGLPEEVPKMEEPNLAEIEKQADLEGEFYEDIFESQRADIPEYEDYLSDLAEASSERPGTAPEMGGERGDFSVQHAVGNANQAQSVLDGINPKYFNPESRFGGGFYVGTDADTIVAELSEHGNIAKYAISYDMNLSGQKVLDLTNPQIASEWGYVQNLTSTRACQNIGEIARTEGYNVIKFQSYRGGGINYVIYNDFENILLPRNVMPID